jgi:hypothetical protein
MGGFSTRPWIFGLALVACRNDGDSEPSALALRSISVPDFGSWECNRPIEFAFGQRIDFASVSARSIHIRTSAGVPAAGTFAARAIDANGDGAPDGTDERVVVFHPSCPLADDLSDAGLSPGARYLVTLAGEDSGADPGALLRSQDGTPLARTVVLAFETMADPASALFDEKPGAPRPLVRARGASTGMGSHLELGEDPGKRVFFEGDPSSGRAPSGFSAPLNLLGDRSSHVAFVLVFDQPIRAEPANLARLSLEYNATLDPSGWRALETRVELLANCRPGEPAVRLVPLGSFSPGGFVRARIEAGFEDFVGEVAPAALDAFAITEVATVAYTSLDPAGAIADELREEFDFGAESPLSLADPSAPLDAAAAVWGQGELRANHEVVALPPELSDFDWIVRSGERLTFDTLSTTILGGPDGQRTKVQTATGGFVAVRNLKIEPRGAIRVQGPNPLVVHASGEVVIRGTIDASGSDAPNLTAFSTNPAQGGVGSAGGGAGGAGSAGPGPRGGDGFAAFGTGAGGRGGESGFAVVPRDETAHRGGGGGGGRFARDQGDLIAEIGGDGASNGTGAESGLSPARGGAAGPEVFTDGDPSNDFFGIEPVVDGSGAVVARRRGELDHIHAGAGGGNGGDSILADAFPPPPDPALLQEGGGGGGGGGAVVIRALGRIVFGPGGQVRANGGIGGQRNLPFQVIGGACGGSGSGGHVILESAVAIDFTQDNPLVAARPWVQAIGGPRVVQLPSPRGFGGAGGPGVVQLHVPHPERAPGDPASSLILPDDSFHSPDPLATVCEPRPHVLYPTVGPRSRARSRWIPLGAAGEGGAAGPESVVAFLFDGIETAPGVDEGKVRTSGERVPELPPLLGPVRLDAAGFELLSDGISLALAGPALAPLRASAQPISPDVYLRTPALLVGHALRLANLAELQVGEFPIAGARYDDATARLTLALGGLSGTLEGTVQALGGAERVELTLVPRFFRVRQGPSGVDLLPDSRFVRILFQGAADDGTGRADEANPLVDWTADVTRFGLLAPGTLDFVRFQVEFELDALDAGFDPVAEPLALDFLRLPFRF